jgi:hypothetical protein
MGQPSTSNQIRAVALKEAVASFPVDRDHTSTISRSERVVQILSRAEEFASFIEHGPEVDPNA